MIYKKCPPFKIRPVEEICADMREAKEVHGAGARTLFFPAGNTIAMPSGELAHICRYAMEQFPRLERVTIYGSSRYIVRKRPRELRALHESGLSRIHVGLESGSDEVLKRVKKGTDHAEQVLAGRMVKDAGIQLSEYVILGLGGVEFSREHSSATADAVNAIAPDFLRLRTLVPKIDTLLLHQIRKGRFQLLSPHGVLRETRELLERLICRTRIASDHYTNYINLAGELPEDRERLLTQIDHALSLGEDRFRPLFVGTQ